MQEVGRTLPSVGPTNYSGTRLWACTMRSSSVVTRFGSAVFHPGTHAPTRPISTRMTPELGAGTAATAVLRASAVGRLPPHNDAEQPDHQVLMAAPIPTPVVEATTFGLMGLVALVANPSCLGEAKSRLGHHPPVT